MSLFQGYPYFRGVHISGVSLFQGYPYFRGVHISGVSIFQGYPYFRGALISGVSLIQGGHIGGCPSNTACFSRQWNMHNKNYKRLLHHSTLNKLLYKYWKTWEINTYSSSMVSNTFIMRASTSYKYYYFNCST